MIQMSSKRKYATPTQLCRLSSLFASAIVASFPLYGFFVHAARDSQETVLWMLLAWAFTLIFLVAWIIVTVTRRPQVMWELGANIAAIAYLFGCLLVGFFGIGHAVVELWAG